MILGLGYLEVKGMLILADLLFPYKYYDDGDKFNYDLIQNVGDIKLLINHPFCKTIQRKEKFTKAVMEIYYCLKYKGLNDNDDVKIYYQKANQEGYGATLLSFSVEKDGNTYRVPTLIIKK